MLYVAEAMKEFLICLERFNFASQEKLLRAAYDRAVRSAGFVARTLCKQAARYLLQTQRSKNFPRLRAIATAAEYSLHQKERKWRTKKVWWTLRDLL